MKKSRVLVCITAQSNSKRLIDRGHAEVIAGDGELHILHVIVGGDVFENENTPVLLDELFDYASKKGAEIHSLTTKSVPETIAEFIKEKGINKIILGEPPKSIKTVGNTILRFVLAKIPKGTEIIIVGREEE